MLDRTMCSKATYCLLCWIVFLENELNEDGEFVKFPSKLTSMLSILLGKYYHLRCFTPSEKHCFQKYVQFRTSFAIVLLMYKLYNNSKRNESIITYHLIEGYSVLFSCD